MTASHATTARSRSVTTQYSSRRALTHRRVLHHRVGMFPSSRPRRSARTRTSASTNPSKTTRADHVPPNAAGPHDDRPRAPLLPLPLLSSSALPSLLSPLLFRSSSPPLHSPPSLHHLASCAGP